MKRYVAGNACVLGVLDGRATWFAFVSEPMRFGSGETRGPCGQRMAVGVQEATRIMCGLRGRCLEVIVCVMMSGAVMMTRMIKIHRSKRNEADHKLHLHQCPSHGCAACFAASWQPPVKVVWVYVPRRVFVLFSLFCSILHIFNEISNESYSTYVYTVS